MINKNLIFHPDLESRLRNVLKKVLSDDAKAFLTSLLDFLKTKNGLTLAQLKGFEKIETHFTPEALKKHEEWIKKFDDEKKRILKICAQYYSNNSIYFRKEAVKILKDPNYIPTEEVFVKITENKYAKKVIEGTDSKPKFNVDDLVSIEKNVNGLPKTFIMKKAFIIIPNAEPVKSAVKGCKIYTILPFGVSHTINIEERYLKLIQRAGKNNES